jgi:hypothetical protein
MQMQATGVSFYEIFTSATFRQLLICPALFFSPHSPPLIYHFSQRRLSPLESCSDDW